MDAQARESVSGKAGGRTDQTPASGNDVHDLPRQLEAERARFEAVLQQLPAGVIIAEAPSGRLVLANDRVEAITGHRFLPVDNIGQYNAYRGFHSDGRPYEPDEWPLARALLTGQAVIGEEIVYERGDGRRIILIVNASPIRDRAGRIIAGVVTFDDVTARKRAEEALFQREQEFKALAENAPDIIARFDRQYRHLYVNPAVERAAGIPPEAFLGKTNRDLGMSDELCTLWEGVLQSVFETGEERTVEFTYPYGDEVRHYQTRLVPEFARDRTVASVLGVSRDMTEHKRLEMELREHVERLAEADTRKNEFLAMLAHELRNPLAPICNALQVLKQLELDHPVLERMRQVMERQALNLTRLVDDLLDVSRITRGKIQLRKEPTDLSRLVERAVDAARPFIDSRGHELIVRMPAAPIHLAADPTRLEQVLTNLLNNAAKFTAPGGRIELTCTGEDGHAVVSVRDTGVGIPPALLPHIFDAFVQADHALGRAQSGLGIGLTLVRTLVEMHGGRVEARSDGPTRGAEFIVRLPAAHPEIADASQAARPEESAGAVARRVLVVDDNVDGAESVSLMLQLMGHDVRVVHSGPAALDVAQTYHPDVILLDIGLPGMSGYDVARQLRHMAMTPRPVLAALTGWGHEEDRRRSREAGFDHHLVKPVEIETLFALLR